MIVYFSATGNSKYVAQELAKAEENGKKETAAFVQMVARRRKSVE